MALDKLLIRKIGSNNFWHRRNDEPLTDRLISEFQVSIDDNFVIVENDGAQSFSYKVENVSVQIDNGIIESNFNRFSLTQKLKGINYTPFINNTNVVIPIPASTFQKITTILTSPSASATIATGLNIGFVRLGKTILEDDEFTYDDITGQIEVINTGLDYLPLDVNEITKLTIYQF
jgi:hypothetical protein